jgi:hypothetical protein
MEEPQKMTSTILETDTEMTISTPKRKSWVLIILFSVLTLQFTNGIIQSLLFADDLPALERIIVFIISTVVIYVVLKALLWQLKGVQEVKISSNELKLSKLSPLWTRTKTYKLSDVKTIEIKNETVSEGPTAMFQLLSIIDRIKITFSYGYETITAVSGIDQVEAIELKDKIESKLRLS